MRHIGLNMAWSCGWQILVVLSKRWHPVGLVYLCNIFQGVDWFLTLGEV
jgi:hypothetical protein